MNQLSSERPGTPVAQETLDPEMFGPPIEHGDQSGELHDESSDSRKASLYELLTEHIRNNTLREMDTIPGIGEAPLDKLRLWVHMHDPEAMAGVDAEVLEKAGLMLADMAPRVADTEGRSYADQQAVYFEAASHLELAARNSQDALERARLRGRALALLKEESDRAQHPSQRQKNESDPALNARLAMLSTDLNISVLVDLYDNRDDIDIPKQHIPADEETLTKKILQFHARELGTFRNMLKTDKNISAQSVAEWMHVLDTRHQIIKNDAIRTRHARVGFAHESNPAQLHGEQHEQDPAYGVAIERRNQTGEWHIEQRVDLMIGGLASDGREVKLPAANISRTIIELNDGGEEDFVEMCDQAIGALTQDAQIRYNNGSWNEMPGNSKRAVKVVRRQLNPTNA